MTIQKIFRIIEGNDFVIPEEYKQKVLAGGSDSLLFFTKLSRIEELMNQLRENAEL